MYFNTTSYSEVNSMKDYFFISEMAYPNPPKKDKFMQNSNQAAASTPKVAKQTFLSEKNISSAFGNKLHTYFS